jgi:hypothetical protein
MRQRKRSHVSPTFYPPHEAAHTNFGLSTPGQAAHSPGAGLTSASLALVLPSFRLFANLESKLHHSFAAIGRFAPQIFRPRAPLFHTARRATHARRAALSGDLFWKASARGERVREVIRLGGKISQALRKEAGLKEIMPYSGRGSVAVT